LNKSGICESGADKGKITTFNMKWFTIKKMMAARVYKLCL